MVAQHRAFLAAWGAAALLVVAGCGGEPAPCDVESVQAALDGAASGDVVTFDCLLTGNLSVPSGVVLEGVGPAAIEAASGVALEVAPGATVRGVAITARGTAGVAVRGVGVTTLEDLTVTALRGVGVATNGGTVRLTRVALEGPVDDPDDPRFIDVEGFAVAGPCPTGATCDCTPGDVDGERVCDASGRWVTFTAVYGLYALGGELEMNEVTIRRFAQLNAALIDSDVRWTGGTVEGALGVGVLVRGGTAHLSGITVSDTAEGLRGAASYGVIAGEGAALTSDALTIRDGDRYGMLTLRATGHHEGLVVQDQGDVAVWVGESTSFTLEGPTSRLSRNGFAGVVIADSMGVTIADARIEDTAVVERTLGAMSGTREVGDGVHIVGSYDAVELRDLTVMGHGRVGVLVDLGPDGAPDITFARVAVDATDATYGAVGGERAGPSLTPAAPGAWDLGIDRSAMAVARDATLSTALDAVDVGAPLGSDAVGIVFPMF